MKEYRISESIVTKIMKRNLIIMGATVLFYLLLSSVFERQSGLSLGMITYICISVILVFSIPFIVGYKIGKRRLRVTKLIFNEDFLIWESHNLGRFEIRYSDIKQVKIRKNRGIILKLRKPFQKIHIFKFIEDFEEVIQLIEKKVKMNEY